MITAWPTRWSGRQPAGGVGEDRRSSRRPRPRCGRRARPARRRGPRRGACGPGRAAPAGRRPAPTAPRRRGRRRSGRRSRAGRRSRRDAAAAPNASAAGAQPEPITTATSCGPPSAAVRASAAWAARAAGSVPGGLVHAGTLTQRTVRHRRPWGAGDGGPRARPRRLSSRHARRGPRTAGGPANDLRPGAPAGRGRAAAPGRPRRRRTGAR